MSQHSETPEEDSDFQDLEEKLSRLKLAAPSEAFTKRLSHRLDTLEQDRAEKRIVWVRFAPVAAAACVVLTSAFLFRGHLLQQQRTVWVDEAFEIELAAGETPGPAPIFNDNPTPAAVSTPEFSDSFPVSYGNFFRGAEDGGIIGVQGDGWPGREWRLGFENTEHWHHPQTGTNLRFLVPARHSFLIPIETD